MAPKSPQSSTPTIDRLTQLLHAAYSKTRISRRVSAILFFTTFLLVGFLCLTSVESLLYLSSVIKSSAVAVIIISSGIAVYLIDRKLGRDSRSQFIKRFLKSRGKQGENIQSALDLFTTTAINRHPFFMMPPLNLIYGMLTYPSSTLTSPSI